MSVDMRLRLVVVVALLVLLVLLEDDDDDCVCIWNDNGGDDDIARANVLTGACERIDVLYTDFLCDKVVDCCLYIALHGNTSADPLLHCNSHICRDNSYNTVVPTNSPPSETPTSALCFRTRRNWSCHPA